jgi:hypothetical protein
VSRELHTPRVCCIGFISDFCSHLSAMVLSLSYASHPIPSQYMSSYAANHMYSTVSLIDDTPIRVLLNQVSMWPSQCVLYPSFIQSSSGFPFLCSDTPIRLCHRFALLFLLSPSFALDCILSSCFHFLQSVFLALSQIVCYFTFSVSPCADDWLELYCVLWSFW